MGNLVMYANMQDLFVGLDYGGYIQSTVFKHKHISVENIQEQLISWVRAILPLNSKLKLIATNGRIFSDQSQTIMRLTDEYARKDKNNPVILIASSLEVLWEIPVFIIDAPSLNEYNSEAFVTGSPDLIRSYRGDTFIFKYLVRQEAFKRKLLLTNTHFIVANLDKEIQIAALSGDKVLDISTSDDDGPFSETQSGGLPFDQLLNLCTNNSSQAEILHLVSEESGLKGYLSDLKFEDIWLTSDEKVRVVREAFVYQIAKEIGALATVLQGKVEVILLTGELSKNTAFIEELVKRINFLGEIVIYPGNYALKSLVEVASQISISKGE